MYYIVEDTIREKNLFYGVFYGVYNVWEMENQSRDGNTAEKLKKIYSKQIKVNNIPVVGCYLMQKNWRHQIK